MNLRHLTYLQAVVAHGSLNKAAGVLGISQPALSKAVASLEAQLGTPLFRRSSSGVSPTAAGLASARWAQSMTDEVHRFRNDVDLPARRPPANTVMVGCGPSEATRLLPTAVAALMSTAPAIRVTVLYGLNEDLMPMVKRGAIDFALSSVPRTATDPQLLHRGLFRDRAAVVCSSRHPLAGARAVTPAMLLDYPWVLARRRELERRALDDLFLRAGLRPPEAAVETTSADMMKSLLMHGDHLSFLPREMIHWEQQTGQLLCIDVGTDDWERQVGITMRRRSRPRRAAQLLLSHISAVAARLF